jgi:integrase
MVEKNTFSVLFFIRKSRTLKNGMIPIYIRITVKGERAEVSANMFVESDSWDTGRGKLKPSAKNASAQNQYLDNLKFKVQEHKRLLLERGKPLTALNLKNSYLGFTEENRGILEIFDVHNKRCKELSGIDFAPGTVERYETARKHVAQFISQKFKRKDLPLTEINHLFIKDFEHFLKIERKCAHNTSLKYLTNFKKIIRTAMENDWIKTDPFKGIKYRLQEIDAEYLNEEELEKIRHKKFSIKRLEKVRDIYIFCCFTGLAFIDVKNLSEENILKESKGRVWIRKRRQKTHKLSSIPLHPIPIYIIDKYKNDPLCLHTGRLLPVSTNQKMNAYLKEIADLCGINKKLTTHTARHTFATTVALSNNISIEAVSEMLGHSSLKMTKRYARVVDDYLGREMDKLDGKYTEEMMSPKDLLKGISYN